MFLFGEDVGVAGGAFKITEGLFERYGAARVRDTPITEQAIIGAAIGAAVMGLRPSRRSCSPTSPASASTGSRTSGQVPLHDGGQVTVPVTVRLGNGAGAGFGAQHSQSSENWLLKCPV